MVEKLFFKGTYKDLLRKKTPTSEAIKNSVASVCPETDLTLDFARFLGGWNAEELMRFVFRFKNLQLMRGHLPSKFLLRADR
jgi:hypothetical protein